MASENDPVLITRNSANRLSSMLDWYEDDADQLPQKPSHRRSSGDYPWLYQVTAVDSGSGTCTVKRRDTKHDDDGLTVPEIDNVTYRSSDEPRVDDIGTLHRLGTGELIFFAGGGTGGGLLLEAQEDMTDDYDDTDDTTIANTTYSAKPVLSDGTLGDAIDVIRPPGVEIRSGQRGVLSISDDGMDVFLPDEKPLLVEAQEDMTEDYDDTDDTTIASTTYEAKPVLADGTLGDAIDVIRPEGVFVSQGDIGSLVVSDDGVDVFFSVHHGPDATDTADAISRGIGEGESADSTAWSVADDRTKGIDITMVTRVDYYHLGNQDLYGYERVLSFDEYGHLVSVSGEQRVIIDDPEVLN